MKSMISKFSNCPPKRLVCRSEVHNQVSGSLTFIVFIFSHLRHFHIEAHTGNTRQTQKHFGSKRSKGVAASRGSKIEFGSNREREWSGAGNINLWLDRQAKLFLCDLKIECEHRQNRLAQKSGRIGGTEWKKEKANAGKIGCQLSSP